MATQDCSPLYRKTTVPLWQRGYHLAVGLTNYRQVLNCTDNPPEAERDLAAHLRQAANAIKYEAIDEQGHVNYAKLRDTDAYAAFRRLTLQLQRFPLESLSTHEEKLAFWINLYNVLVIDGVIQFGLKTSVRDVRGFFVKAAYNIDGYRFSLDDIEHGILRMNKGNPAIPGAQFVEKDPRLMFQAAQMDARIHFTLVCGALSCPPIGFYRHDTIDGQLDVAARAFVDSEVQVDLEAKTVRLSQIFQWYAPDFGGSLLNQVGQGDFGPVLRFIVPYVQDETARQALMDQTETFKVSFRAYDWGLNLLIA